MPRRSEPPLNAEDTPDPAHAERKLPDPAGTVHTIPPGAGAAAPDEPPDAVEAFEVGEHFLREATEQDNYESEQRPEVDHDLAGEPVAELLSEATLEAAQQADLSLPISAALSDPQPEVLPEPAASGVDLTSDAIRAASLFDQPVAEQDEEDEEAGADDPELAVAAPLREPSVASDDPSDVDDERLAEIQRAFDERVKRRLRVSQLPKERAAAPSAPPAAPPPPRPAPRRPASPRVRHAERALRSSRRAAKVVREMTGLDDTPTALAALQTVAGAIVRRITPVEADDFIAQLPSELQDGLLSLPAGPDRGISRDTLQAELAARLSLAPERAAALAEGVGAALCVLISDGEIEDLRAQLPPDLRGLLPEGVLHQNP